MCFLPHCEFRLGSMFISKIQNWSYTGPLLIAAGSAAPWLLLSTCASSATGQTKAFFSASFPSWETLHLLTSNELPSSLPMKFQNPAVELQFNNTKTKGCPPIVRLSSLSHSPLLTRDPPYFPCLATNQGSVEHCLPISPFPGWPCVPH